MSIIEKDSLVFDIGANWGQSAQRYLDAGAGRIISVEPCLENYIVLQRKAALDPRIVPIHAAAWAYPKVIEARFATNEPGWSSVQPEKWIKAYPNAKWGGTGVCSGIKRGSFSGQVWQSFLHQDRRGRKRGRSVERIWRGMAEDDRVRVSRAIPGRHRRMPRHAGRALHQSHLHLQRLGFGDGTLPFVQRFQGQNGIREAKMGQHHRCMRMKTGVKGCL